MSVLVYVENWDGKFKKLSYELISYASKVAEMMNTNAVALSIGKVEGDELMKIRTYGAAKIINAQVNGLNVLDNQVYAGIISEQAAKENASVIVISNNNTGKGLAPRIAVRMKAGLGAGVSKLPLSIDPFVVYKKVYSGNAYAQIKINSPVRVLTLSQNSFGIIETGGLSAIEEITLSSDMVAVRTELLETQKQSGKILLTDAEIVVSGGRGMKSPDNWGPLVELAALLNAGTACSRPVSDEGWRPHEEHTGQTGKIIAPNLYIAVGISGATQHIAGVSASKYIVAINSDRDAPIFESAQYGIIGDAQKILPALVEAVKEMKNK